VDKFVWGELGSRRLAAVCGDRRLKWDYSTAAPSTSSSLVLSEPTDCKSYAGGRARKLPPAAKLVAHDGF